ncbi:arylsulfatase [Paraglaciecola sp. L3A3]|uniref:arylsulfatase n=1 Tax=Paraglaciecola sp. L3A3 TaxID=2686358 RepID=UPI00131C9F08|nr:arylsulfatase [Paraglaciecola sp. L3A3]
MFQNLCKSGVFYISLLILLTGCQTNNLDNKSILSKHVRHDNTSKPNIIYILADDLGYGEIGAYGQTKIHTPNLDKLAKQGLKFTQHYSGSTVCAPTRSTIMEGKHTGYSTVRGNKTLGENRQRGNYPLPTGSRTIAHMFQEQGYKTGIFGKWGLGGINSTGHPAKQGFDAFSGYLDHRHAHNYFPDYIYRFGNEVELNNKVKVHGLGKNPSLDYKSYLGNDYVPDLMLEDAMQFMKQHKNDKFFLYYPLTLPHTALQPIEESLQQYKGLFEEDGNLKGKPTPHQYPKAAYAAMVTHIDKHVGMILAELERLNLDQNTIVMFSSDNGAEQNKAYNNFFGSNGGLRGYKRDLYEGAIRAPLLVKWPNKIKANSTTEHISAQWDLMATFGDIIDAKPNADTNGISFLPTLLQQPQPKHHHLYWEFWKQQGLQAVRMGQWKGIRLNVNTNPNNPIELYNLSNDPFEKHNVAKQYPEIVKKIELAMLDRAISPESSWNPPSE